MILDTYTLQIALTVAATVSAVLFLLDAFLRQADVAGRVWSLGFVAGIVSSFSLTVASLYPMAWWSSVISSGTMVFALGAFWSGCRAYNRRSPDLVWIGFVAALLAAGTVFAFSAAANSLGVVLPFVAVAVFGGLGLWESLRAPMRRHWTARGLSVIFAVVAIFFAARAAVVAFVGPEAEVLQTLLGRGASAILMISLTITTAVCMTILQSERVPRVGERGATIEFTSDGLLTKPELLQIADDWAERADFHGEQVVVLRFELDELESLGLAYGATAATQLSSDFGAIVRRYAGSHTVVADDGPGVVLVAGVYRRMSEALDSAEEVRQGLREERISSADGIHLTASIGAASSDHYGYDVMRLVDAATKAAQSARTTGGDALARG